MFNGERAVEECAVLKFPDTQFLYCTTYEKKNGFLLIEVFRKLFNPQNYGHQGTILGGLSCIAGVLRISRLHVNFH
jgi:hypothetical protein